MIPPWMIRREPRHICTVCGERQCEKADTICGHCSDDPAMEARA